MSNGGMRGLALKYQRARDGFEQFARKFLLEMGLRALAKTKRRTPVRTGLLRNSWQLGNQKISLSANIAKRKSERKYWKAKGTHGSQESYTVRAGEVSSYSVDPENSSDATLESVTRNGDTLEITLSNPVEYAMYVEYGHKLTPWGSETGATKTDLRSRGDWVEGRFMATVSILEVMQEMPARYQAAMQAYLDSLGGGG